MVELNGWSGVVNEIFERVSVRDFADRAVEAEKIEMLLRAAMQAPSAGNQQPWEFLVIDDREILESIMEVHPYSGMLRTAPLCIAVLARKDGLNWEGMIQQDLGAATQNLMLEAVTQGLGSCWLGVMGHDERMQTVNAALGLPSTLDCFCLVAVGYAATERAQTARYDESRVHHNRF
jgi:nitroreductase